jgi:hypothetical protein
MMSVLRLHYIFLLVTGVVVSVCFALTSPPERYVSVAAGAAKQSHKFYVYDWPDVTYQYSKHKNDFDPVSMQNYGAGPEVPGAGRFGFFATWQFALFKLMHERLLRDPRRTLHPEEATTFFVPYDFGLDACFRPDNGKMRKINCPLAEKVSQRLYHSPYFNASFGLNHVLIVSVNQNMNYFLGASNCQRFLSHTCYNCTKLAIDEYSWLHSVNRVEAALGKRGDYWHAIPFPSNIHYVPQKMQAPYPWQQEFTKKTILVSYTGSLSSFNPVSSRLRKQIGFYCEKYRNMTQIINGLLICETTKYASPQTRAGSTTVAAPSPSDNLPLYCRSIFCFQPPGDMPTRKSVFDSILCGCIPVFFNLLTGPLMYEWHWDMDTWANASVYINHETVRELHRSFNASRLTSTAENTDSEAENGRDNTDDVDIVKVLIDLYKLNYDKMVHMQQVIATRAMRLQYSLPPEASEPVKVAAAEVHLDAYEIAVQKVLSIHAGQSTHARIAHYMICDDVYAYNVDWCVPTGRNEDLWTAEDRAKHLVPQLHSASPN